MNISRLSCRRKLNEALENNTEHVCLFTRMHYCLIWVDCTMQDYDMDFNPGQICAVKCPFHFPPFPFK